jgi:hypothetical protein
MLDDLLKKRETAYVKLDEQMYRAEQELADKYRSFVAEILRLSLGGVAVFSFIYKQGADVPQTRNFATKDVFAFTGVAMFSLSLVCSLVFLYSASEGLRWYIAGLRVLVSEAQVASGKQSPDYLAQRDKWILHCRWSKLLAALMLALGGICMALAIFS